MKEENGNESDLALEEMRKKENEIVTLSSPYETTEKGYKRAQNVKAKPSWKKCQIFFFIIVLLIILLGIYYIILKKGDYIFVKKNKKNRKLFRD